MSYGQNRVVNQIMNSILAPDQWEKLTFEQVLSLAPNRGIFLNTFTFEVDLFRSGAEGAFAEAVNTLTTNKKIHARFKSLSGKPKTLDPAQFLKDIDSIGKGRVAHRGAHAGGSKPQAQSRRTDW
jgi:putative ATP-dependent endonuclease of OLD family